MGAGERALPAHVVPVHRVVIAGLAELLRQQGPAFVEEANIEIDLEPRRMRELGPGLIVVPGKFALTKHEVIAPRDAGDIQSGQ